MADNNGKIAIVTGAASGMGRATALRMAQDGYQVVIADINEQGAGETRQAITADGGSASVQVYDATDSASCTALVKKVVEDCGRLDLVVNAAGIGGFYHLHELTDEIFQRFMAINLCSVMTICREAMPYLKAVKGCIVNFASINSRIPVAYHAAYDASKAGVLALTKSIAQEFALDGVRCNAICPGGFDTPMNDNIRMPDSMDHKWLAKLSHPEIPFADAKHAASVVAFLVSDDAAFVNGESIVADGGVSSII